MNGRRIDAAFWGGKRVLVTGHTGFKGSWLISWLKSLGAEIAGLALEPNTTPSIFTSLNLDQSCHHQLGDIRNASVVERVIGAFRPDIVFHMAAQPLVRHSYSEPVETFSTNVMGTVHVLDACRRANSVRVIVNVTTDKVYANHQWLWGYRESDHLGGEDPYSASKAAAELVAQAWRASFLAGSGIAVASARAGNVIGGGDFCADRIIPDAVRAFARNEPLIVRRPAAVRPWQLVVEPLAGYLLLAESCWSDPCFADSWNFGPDSSQVVTVRDIADGFCTAWGSGARWTAPEDTGGPKEAELLLLDSAKARQRLHWRPGFDTAQSLKHTAEWYRALLAGASARELRDLTLATIAAHQTRVAE